jgi:uncharacterized protein with HEPN domain
MQFVEPFVAGPSFEEFDRDEKTRSAVVRHLGVIGEAVKGIPPLLRQQHPSVP